MSYFCLPPDVFLIGKGNISVNGDCEFHNEKDANVKSGFHEANNSLRPGSHLANSLARMLNKAITFV